MRIGILGTNFKTARLNLREELSLACQKRLSTFGELGRKYACVVLATCNRVEIYFSATDLAEAHSEILQVLKEEVKGSFEHQLYSYFGLDCFLHLSQVTAGLDSAIVAESEIQRQVKIAYEHALEYRALPSCIHYLFQKSLQIGKYIRSHFSLALNQVTIPKLLFEIGHLSYVEQQKAPILFIGNSEINRQIISYFRYKGLKNLTLCSRSFYAVEEAAERIGVTLVPWEHRLLWNNYSYVICGSSVPYYVVTPLRQWIQTRWIFDLSMPRTVDPEVTSDGQAQLMNMEQLINRIQDRQQSNTEAVIEAQQVIVESVGRYLEGFLSKEARMKLCVG